MSCQVMCVANQKGGVGKTTTTFNLGVALAKNGKRVLLIDADPQGDLTTYMGWHNADNIPITLSTIMGRTMNDEVINPEEAILHHNEGVDLIPTNLELASMEVSLVNAMSREYTMRNSISDLKKNYDYILIDCMPSLGMITINALASADKVIIPVQSEFLAAKGMSHLMTTILKVKKQINPRLDVAGILLTLVDERRNLSKEISEELKNSYGKVFKLYETQIPRAVKAAESSRMGESILSYDKESKVTKGYLELAKEVLNDERAKIKARNTNELQARWFLYNTRTKRWRKERKIEEIDISLIDNFKNHPFKVLDNEELSSLEESIKSNGMMEAVIIRQKDNGRYEMISGHRRLLACKKLGLPTIPCRIRNLTDDEATIFMVDSNLHREKLLPSEKAFAYKMKYDALKNQRKLAANQLDSSVRQVGAVVRSDDLLGDEHGDSGRQVQRYIRLTNLIPELLQMVDNSEIKESPSIALTPAVEISYLKKDEQKSLAEYIGFNLVTPSLAQAIKLRELSTNGILKEDNLESLLDEPKANQIQKIQNKRR